MDSTWLGAGGSERGVRLSATAKVAAPNAPANTTTARQPTSACRPANVASSVNIVVANPSTGTKKNHAPANAPLLRGDYPDPIVDHAQRRQLALERYKAAQQKDRPRKR